MITVEVVYALPDEEFIEELELESGATVRDALNAVADRAPFSTLDLQAADVGIFGKVCADTRLLLSGDRVEIYRPLKMDPMAARRARVP